MCTLMRVSESDNQMLLGERKVKVTEGASWRFTGAQVPALVRMHISVCL